MTTTIYTASKVRHAKMWQAWRWTGHNIISTWIDEADEGQTQDLEDLWIRCIAEASRASVLIAYREPGEVLKGAFVEIGAALGNDRRVMLVGDFAEFSFVRHPNVIRPTHIGAAMRMATRGINIDECLR